MKLKLRLGLTATIIAALLPPLLGAQVPAPPPTINLFVSSYICCGSTASDQNRAVGFAYDPASCNKVGVTGKVRLSGTTVTYDDPMNVGKVCSYDAASLLAGLPAGMWDIQTTMIMGPSTDFVYNLGVHRSDPFPLGGFVPQADPGDPCAIPLGINAAALFLTKLEYTTQHPGSQSRLNFQLGGNGAIVAVAVVIDGAAANSIAGTDLTSVGGIWFTQPALGSHTIGLKATNSAGCSVSHSWVSPLVSK